MNKYTHLNLHSEYSIQDGLIRINDLAEKAYDLNFESLAITDLSNLFGFIKFYFFTINICNLIFKAMSSNPGNRGKKPGRFTKIGSCQATSNSMFFVAYVEGRYRWST